MKRIISTFLLVVIVSLTALNLVGCGEDKKSSNSNENKSLEQIYKDGKASGRFQKK